MDSFELNKIAGAVLGTALLVMALSITSEIIYHSEAPEQPGYVIAVAETESGGAPEGGAPGVAPIAARLQTADAAAGEASARKCQACHTFQQGEPAKVGPNLYGIVLNHAAHMEGFRYSAAMTGKNAEGMQWTYEELDRFLDSPRAEVPGTSMAFAGLKRPDERANVIAYLRTLADSPVPLPEAPAEDAAPADEAAPPAEGAAPVEGTAPETGETPTPQGSEVSPSAPATQPPTDAAPAESAEPPADETVPPAVPGAEPQVPEPPAPAEPVQ